MAQAPRVSVIIPTHNRALWVREAVQSVLRQTFRDREVIVVDDGSSDNTKEILQPFKNLVRLLPLHRTHGPAHARNTGISASRGEFIAFLDSDDRWYPYKLERQLRRFEDPRILWTVGEVDLIDGRGKLTVRRYLKHYGYLFRRNYEGGFTMAVCSTLVLRRAVLRRVGLFDPLFRRAACEAMDFQMRLDHRLGPKAVFSDPLPLAQRRGPVLKRNPAHDPEEHRQKMLDWACWHIRRGRGKYGRPEADSTRIGQTAESGQKGLVLNRPARGIRLGQA